MLLLNWRILKARFNNLAFLCGGVRERFNRAVLKTVVPRGTVGSNPTPAAKLIADNGVMFLIGRCSRNAKMCRTYELII